MRVNIPHRTPLLTHYIDKWAMDTPGKIAVIQAEEGKQWMYRQLAQQINAYVQKLLEQGVEVGDRVLGALSDTPEQVALMWACWKVGAVFVPVDIQLFQRGLKKLLVQTQPKAFFLSHQAARVLHHLTYPIDPTTCSWIMVPKGKFLAPPLPEIQVFQAKKYLSRLNFSKKKYLNMLPKRQKEIHAWSPLLMLPSSPQLSDYSAPLVLCMDHIYAQVQALNDYLHIDKHNKTLAFHPFRSLLSLIHQVISPLIVGGTTILTHATQPQEWSALIGRYHVNTLWTEGGLPQTLVPSHTHYTSLKHIISTRSPYQAVDPVKKVCSHQLNQAEALSLPETGGIFAIQSKEKEDLFIPQCRISIRQPMSAHGKDGRECEPGQIGMVCIHPPMVFSGFLQGNGISSPRVSNEGLLYTGIQGALQRHSEQTFLRILPHKVLAQPMFAA